MQRLGRDHRKLESLNLFALLPEQTDESLFDPMKKESFLAQIGSGLAEALDSESTLHGVRVQSMFEGMVANLGAVRLIKQEDAGECFYQGDSLQPPDFRIITFVGSQLLVEVKNYYSNDPMKAFRLRADDVRKIARYSALVGATLKIAIYWSRWNLWTLNRIDTFKQSGKYYSIPFSRAVTASEMALLGDVTVATEVPLTMTLTADQSKTRSVSPDGTVTMEGTSRELRCGGTLIADATEKNILLYLMIYGKWQYDGGRVQLDEGGLPSAVVHTVAPEKRENPHENFEMIGSLSSLYSNLYNSLTLEDGKLTRLRVKDPTALAPVIPLKFEKKALSLWRFVNTPDFGAEDETLEGAVEPTPQC